MFWILGDSASWNDVSSLGQAYSGVAALLSAFALIGVAVSIYLQWRLMQIQLKAQVGQRHFEIVKLTMEVPELRTIGLGTNDPVTAVRWLFANLWMSYWVELWDIGELDEAGLRSLVRFNLANDEAIRAWWNNAMERGGWSKLRGRRRLQFEHIVSEEFRDAEPQEPSKVAPAPAG